MPKWVLSHLCGSCWSLSTQLSRDGQVHISAQCPVPASPPYSPPVVPASGVGLWWVLLQAFISSGLPPPPVWCTRDFLKAPIAVHS